MKLTIFKKLISIGVLLGLLLVSCSDDTNPLQSDVEGTKTLKKQEFMPSLSQSKAQTESVLSGIMESVAYNNIASYKIGDEPTGGVNYNFLNGWHTWTADISMPVEGIPDAYQLKYLSRVQFQDGTNTVQAQPTGAEVMLMSLNSHGRFGFIGDDPRGDEVWFNYQGGATPLNGNPSMVSIIGNYERRWVGDYSEDGENWETIELHYNVNFLFNSVEFVYDWINNDFTLNGVVLMNVGEYIFVITFENSRKGTVEIYGDASPFLQLRKQVVDNRILVDTYKIEIPNFYEQVDIPSLNEWNFNLLGVFPAPIVL